jgi:hypothetical protein
MAIAAATGVLIGGSGSGPLSAPAAALIARPAAARPAPGVVLIGATDLGWAGVSARTPTLAALVSGARAGVPGTAVGSLSVRSAQTPTCPVDGWSTISAGLRASGPARAGGRCPALPRVVSDASGVPQPPPGAAAAAAPVAGRVVGWSALAARDRTNAYRAGLGTLATSVTAAGGCLTAVGPGAALAGASPVGTVAHYLPAVGDLDPADLDRCRVTLVDAGSGAPAADRALRRVLAVAPTGTTVLLATVADGAPGGPAQPNLGLVAEQTVRRGAMVGSDAASTRPASRGHLLTSDSTDWPGVVALTDLTPTLLADAGSTAPAVLTGSVVTTAGGAVPDLAGLQTVAVRARVAGAQVETWFTLAGIAAVLLVGALVVRRRSDRWSPRADRALEVVAGVVFCLPVSTRLASLLPWWQVGVGRPASSQLGDRATAVALWAAQLGTALILVVAVLLMARAGMGRRSRPADPPGPPTSAGAVVAVLAAVSTVAVVVDVAVGSPLSRLAVIGLLPIDGSRFHGFGNEIVAAVDSAVLLGASIAVGPLVRRGRAVLAGWMIAAAGLAFAAVDGLPGLGDDFGGVPAAVVGAGVGALVAAGSRLRPLRLAAVGGAGVLLAVALALGDAARGPGRRTHVGDFVADLAHGTAGPILSRKAGSVVGPFAGDNGAVAAVAVWVGLAVVLALGVVVLRPAARTGILAGLDGPWPAWRAGLAGTGAAAVVGSALNDSGIIVALVATGTAVAAVTAVLTGTAADQARQPGSPGTPGAAGHRANSVSR